MSKKTLFDEDSDEHIAIKTENEYAKKYDTWREKEEIHKLEQKYGPKVLESGGSVSSDSEDESDEPPELSEEVETQFLKTLALLKTKDPRIYDPSFKCFDQEEQKKLEEKSKPKTLTFDDSDDDDDGGDIFKIEKKAEIDDPPKDSPKKNKKEKKLKEYLTGKAEHIDEEVEKDLAPLKALWSDPKLNEGEAFLRDYILNKRYLEDGEAGDDEAGDRLRDDADLEADEQTVEEQSKFERAYNFRFEEPDDEYLKRFPRTMNSIRPKDDRRSRKRAEVRARKDEEKARKMEEIARLKALKLKEIQDKIAKIKEVTGNQELGFKDEDIEGDFDPEEHDRRMKALFDEQYYGEADNEKPVFPEIDEELEIENWDKYDVDAEQTEHSRADDGPHCEDEDFIMDADYDPKRVRAGLLEEIQKTLGKKRRNRKRKSKLAELLSADKPKFVPEADKTYDQYMDEYYKMDCEDVLGGDLPTRFKYREVVPNDYGLTVEEILLADDRELTQWVPLKRIVKHRPEAVEKGEVRSYAQRAADLGLKRKMLPSLFRDLPEEPELVVPVEEGSKKKKKKKRKSKEKNGDVADAAEELDETSNADVELNSEGEPEVKKKKKKQLPEENTETCNTESNNELNQNDRTEVKRKKKMKSIKQDNSISIEEHEVSTDKIDSEITSTSDLKPKKSKKDKSSKEYGDVTNRENNSSNVTVNIKKETPNQIEEHKAMNKSMKNNSNVNKNINLIIQKRAVGAFVVEEVSTQGPSQESGHNISNTFNKGSTVQSSKGAKRKLTHKNSNEGNKRKKHDMASSSKSKDFKIRFNQSDKFKHKKKFNNKQNNDKSNENPLSTLSDERLKAYGLNPKKYKNFLKYKKF